MLMMINESTVMDVPLNEVLRFEAVEDRGTVGVRARTVRGGLDEPVITFALPDAGDPDYPVCANLAADVCQAMCKHMARRVFSILANPDAPTGPTNHPNRSRGVNLNSLAMEFVNESVQADDRAVLGKMFDAHFDSTSGALAARLLSRVRPNVGGGGEEG